MPLHQGKSNETFKDKLQEMIASGHPLKQAVASAYDEASYGAQRDSARKYDTNGWFVVKENPVTKAGVFPYLGKQLSGSDSIDPDKVYKVFRPREELAAPKFLESMKLLPLIDGHNMLGSSFDDLLPAEIKGVHGVTGEGVFLSDNGIFYAPLKVFSEELKRRIDSGKTELSLGYRCVYDWTPGVFDGEQYDAIQRDLDGNHVALVDAGRCGAEVAVLDEQIKSKMEGKRIMDRKTVEDAMKSMMDSLFGEEKKEDKEPMAKDEKKEDEAKDSMSSATKAEVTSETAKEKAAADEKEDDDKKEEKKSEDSEEEEKKEKKSEAADAAAFYFKDISKRFQRRDKLADTLSYHVGAFDAAEMTEEEVASYGIKKLGLKYHRGQEIATITGFLQGAAKQIEAAKNAVAMDSAPSDNFIERALKLVKGAK